MPQVLFADRFTTGGKLGNSPGGGGFGSLPPGIGIDFRIQHQNVHVVP